MPKKGDLVHIPSQTRLEKFAGDDQIEVTAQWKTFKQPKKLLVTESDIKYGYIGVFFQDETWYVKENDVFILEEDNE